MGGRGGFRRGGRLRQSVPAPTEDASADQSTDPSADPTNTQDNKGPSNDASESGTTNGRINNPKVNALVQLLEKTGPAIILVHSAAGPTGYEATRQRGDLVQGLITVEVTGTPSNSSDIEQNFAGKRLIAVYGDNFDLRPMQGRYEASAAMVKAIQTGGAKAAMIWLPERNIHGNSHLLLQDNNNDEIARMILVELNQN